MRRFQFRESIRRIHRDYSTHEEEEEEKFHLAVTLGLCARIDEVAIGESAEECHRYWNWQPISDDLMLERNFAMEATPARPCPLLEATRAVAERAEGALA